MVVSKREQCLWPKIFPVYGNAIVALKYSTLIALTNFSEFQRDADYHISAIIGSTSNSQTPYLSSTNNNQMTSTLQTDRQQILDKMSDSEAKENEGVRSSTEQSECCRSIAWRSLHKLLDLAMVLLQ